MSTQQVTPELRQWIVEQVQAGHTVESVLKSMRSAGWDEDVAVKALETTLQDHLRGLTGGGADSGAAQAADALPEAVPVPDVRLEGSPLHLDLGDRRVDVISVMNKPRVVVLGNFMSDEECDAIIETSRARLARSLTVSVKTGGEEVHQDRTSYGTFLKRGESEVVTRIEQRIARMIDWPIEFGEGIQVLRYGPGAEYKPHYDYFDPKEPGTPTILTRGGQRVATVVMYLSEPEGGGGTVFPDVGLDVSPKRGNAVFFSYDRPHPSSKTLHGGAPVIAGEKWIATKWLRQREFT